MTELVSVIIPVYQVEEKYLRTCAESVLGQTYRNLEILFVSDGAPEHLNKLLSEFAEGDHRVRVITRENGGASAARNTGLDACRGEYVTFVDSDDYIDPETIACALERMQRDALQVLLWGSCKFRGDHEEEYRPYDADVTLFEGEMKRQLMMKTMVGSLPVYLPPATGRGSGSCCSKLYSVQFLREHGLHYPEGIKRAEDVNFNIRVFDAAERIGYLNRRFYYYRQHEGSATYQYRENGIEVFTGALEKLREFLKDTGKDETFRKIFYMRCMFFFLESLDMDTLHRKNPDPFGVKVRKLRARAKEEPYRTAFAQLQLSDLTFAKKIPLILIKGNMMGLLCLFYKAYGLMQRKEL